MCFNSESCPLIYDPDENQFCCHSLTYQNIPELMAADIVKTPYVYKVNKKTPFAILVL